MPEEGFALLIPGLGLALAFVMDRLAALRRPGGERGDYWTRVAAGLCGIGLLCLLSGCLPAVSEPLWLRGLHLQLDRVQGSGLSRGSAYLTALALPFVLWASILLACLISRPGDREAGRWLAGRAGDLPRAWVLLCALPLLTGLLFGYSRLGAGPEGYPAATWSTQALLVISLLFVARSAGSTPAVPRGSAQAEEASGRTLRPWPEALASRGIGLRPLLAWPADPPPRRVEGSAAELANRLHALGARGVAPELVEASARLLNPPRRGAPATCLVFAPDACGQTEMLGLTAGDVAQRFNEVTLVIVPSGPEILAIGLQRWLPGDCKAEPVGRAGKPPDSAAVWVIDAETLSERFLRRLANDRFAHRIGLVVWWDVHRYTGILAANVWAISRRLDRLMRAQGRSEVRLLVLVRGADHGDAQLPRFVRELLPYSLSSDSEIHVERRAPRELQVHLLEDHRGYFEKSDRVRDFSRHPLLVAALASAEEGWPTFLTQPRGVTDFEINSIFQLPVEDRKLGDRLLPDVAVAGARLSDLEAGEVLSIVAIASQGGRGAPDGLPHHWALTLPENPYARFFLTRWAEENPGAKEMPASRRLVGARGNPGLLRRHLLQALSEQKDTLANLNRTFRWEEELIQRTLEWIASEKQLDRSREVRFLTPEDRLHSDYLYESRLSAEDEFRPLDAVGTGLIEVREVTSGFGDGIRMRVDPERLTIQAYPGRVFFNAGQRYEVATWDSWKEVVARGWVGCLTQAASVRTWRVRRPNVYRFQKPGPEVAVDPEGKLVKRFAVDLTYEEEVVGFLRLERDLATGLDRHQIPELRRPIACSFNTRALVLRLPFAPPRQALEALCLALRYVLPVHLGVDDDALEVVALPGEPEHRMGNSQLWGVAVVDLYPGGIGLADAVAEDTSLPLKLLQWARDWLRQPGADASLLASPLARATLGRELPDPAAAVDLLGRLLGSRRD